MTTPLPAPVQRPSQAPPRPQLPEFLESRLRLSDQRVETVSGDPPALWVPWKAPAASWVAEHKLAIREALASLEVHSMPAPEPLIRQLLARCAEVKASKRGTPAEWAMRAAEYVRLLGHYPADIWSAAIDQQMLASKWFPDISELEELMRPMLDERETGISRLREMLDPPTRLAAPAISEEERTGMQTRLGRLRQIAANGALLDLTEDEAKTYCETGEYPADFTPRPSPRKAVDSPRSRARRELLQVRAAAARAAFMGIEVEEKADA